MCFFMLVCLFFIFYFLVINLILCILWGVKQVKLLILLVDAKICLGAFYIGLPQTGVCVLSFSCHVGLVTWVWTNVQERHSLLYTKSVLLGGRQLKKAAKVRKTSSDSISLLHLKLKPDVYYLWISISWLQLTAKNKSINTTKIKVRIVGEPEIKLQNK